MKKIICLFILLLIPSVVFPMGPGQKAGKPLPPVKVSIAPLEEGLLPEGIRPGETVELKITAVSSVDAEDLKLEVKLSGAELLSGETKWNGPVKKGEEKALIIRVRAPMKGTGTVKATASVETPEGHKFKGHASYKLGEEPKKKDETRPVKKDSRGREIIEYPAK